MVGIGKRIAGGDLLETDGGRYVARSFLKVEGDAQPKAATVSSKKVVATKKKATTSEKEAPPPGPGFLGVPGLIITFGHKNQQ